MNLSALTPLSMIFQMMVKQWSDDGEAVGKSDSFWCDSNESN